MRVGIMLYSNIIRPFLFRINPGKAYMLAMKCLHMARANIFTRYIFDHLYKSEHPSLKKNVMGLDFPNPVGLAAGLDKNARYSEDLGACGFGFIEIGTVTPKPRKSPSDYSFSKIHHEKSIVSNVGIANKGVLEVINNIKNAHPGVLLAANISHDVGTLDDDLKKDYGKMVSLLYDFVDFFVINASYSEDYTRSPFEDPQIMADVMDEVLDKRSDMDQVKPVLIKVSPDIPLEQLDEIMLYSMASGVDGLVIGDAVRNKPGMLNGKHYPSDGFVSGTAIREKILELVRHAGAFSRGKLSIIACGGVMSAEDAKAMLEAGASLVEIMSGFIYGGPKAVRTILKTLDNESGKDSVGSGLHDR